MSDEDLVNALAQYLDLEPIEKQALLEQPGRPDARRALIELLEMRALTAKTPGASLTCHTDRPRFFHSSSSEVSQAAAARLPIVAA